MLCINGMKMSESNHERIVRQSGFYNKSGAYVAGMVSYNMLDYFGDCLVLSNEGVQGAVLKHNL